MFCRLILPRFPQVSLIPAVRTWLRSFMFPVTTATVTLTCHLLSSVLSSGWPQPISVCACACANKVSSSNSMHQQTFLPSDLLFMAAVKLNKSTWCSFITYPISLPLPPSISVLLPFRPLTAIEAYLWWKTRALLVIKLRHHFVW